MARYIRLVRRVNGDVWLSVLGLALAPAGPGGRTAVRNGPNGRKLLENGRSNGENSVI